MTEGTREQQQTESPWPSLVSMGSVLLAATALGAGLAFFMGWSYERAYIEEWGLAFSAFSYSPHELMVASSATLLLVASMLFGLLVGLFGDPLIDAAFEYLGLRPPGAASSGQRADRIMSRVIYVGLVAVLIYMVVIEEWRIAVIVGVTVVSITFIVAWRTYKAGNRQWGVVAIFALVAGAYLLIAVAPARLGEADAKLDREKVERLPRAELVLIRSLGLDAERTEDGHILTGPWRIIRVNSGRIWLIPDVDGASEVTQIDESDIASLTYLPDDQAPVRPVNEKTPTPTVTPGLSLLAEVGSPSERRSKLGSHPAEEEEDAGAEDEGAESVHPR